MIGLALDAISATAAIQSDGGDFIFGPNTPMPDGGSVSYTHLTLPTTNSV